MRLTLLAVSTLCACTPRVAVEGDGGSNADAAVQLDDGGTFGLDGRPVNTTCIAPAPPPSTSGVTTTRAFPRLAFSQPLGLMQAPGDASRIFVQERQGRVRVFPNTPDAGTADVSLVLDLSSRVNAQGEGGFLGMAFHPRWATTTKVLYVSYTETGTGSNPLRSVIARHTSTDNGASFGPEERVLTLDQPFTNHNGGNLAFGPDGFLYVGFGDGGNGGDPSGAGQRLNTLHGKILRLDVDVVGQRYGIPAGNPFAATGTACNLNSSARDAPAGTRCAEIYAWGFRNPWRFAFDADSGELWVGDVGQGAWEEVDRVTLGGNYGWNTREGAHCYNPRNGCSTAGLIDPVVEYDRTQGQSITGGFVYRGTSIPWLRGRFIFGDYGSGRIWAVTEDPQTGAPTSTLLQDTNLGLASFGQTLDGEVFALNIANGQVFRLAPSGAAPTDMFPQRLSETGCFDPADPRRPLPALVPYELNAALWSDGAAKERFFAIPDGTTITVGADGDLDLPPGSVTAKTFFIEGKRVETRLFMRHQDGSWAGYSYEWNDDETDAVLLPAAKSKTVAAQRWAYPSRAQCLACHTSVAGRTLGLELAQLDREVAYPTGRRRAQVATLAGVGLFSLPASLPTRLEAPLGTGPLEARARSYLHANCSGCHRQNAGQGPADFRASLSLRGASICNQAPDNGSLGLPDAGLLVPGAPERSVLSVRMHALDANRMPPLGTSVVDADGVALIDEWIRSLPDCP